MRFVAPARDAVASDVLARPPLSDWAEHGDWLLAGEWPSVESLNAAGDGALLPNRFVKQTPALLADGFHYEQRIFARNQIATREHNWHDLFNALVWLRFPQIKSALNARQVNEIAVVGPRQRSRAQCALTHFDEGGAIVTLRDRSLLEIWDAHDWVALFCDRRQAWSDGSIQVQVFGHALLEHALRPGQMLVSKTLVVCHEAGSSAVTTTVARAIGEGAILNDPQELRPLPLSGIPGWHGNSDNVDFYRTAACFRPLRVGRRYPAPLAGD
jgi:Protein of unknown function (DUF3025)